MSVFMLSVVIVASTIPAAAASGRLPGHFFGQAYAAQATANTGDLAVHLGRVAWVPCPCQGTKGKVHKNQATNVKSGDLASIGVTETKAFGKKTTNRTAKTWTAASVTDLNLLDGLITADFIRARSQVLAKTDGYKLTSLGSKFVNLRIAGKAIASSVKPGKKINLPGLGYVKLKEVRPTGKTNGRRSLTVTMIRIHVSVGGNEYGLPVGAEIIVARARSGYDRSPIKVFVRGNAFDTNAWNTTASIKNRIGKAAWVWIGCEGTDGKVKTNTVTDFRAGQTLRVDTGRTTAMGKRMGDRGVARTTAQLENAWLLDLDLPIVDKLIKIDLLKAVAKATYDRGDRHGWVSSNGSSLVNISIADVIDIPINVPANTKVDIPGVGRVVLNKQDVKKSKFMAEIRVTMFVLVIENPVLGLPVGTRIELAKAIAWAGR